MNELAEIISKNEDKIRTEWIRDMGNSVERADLMGSRELEEQCRTLLSAVVSGIKTSGPDDFNGAGWEAARDHLRDISISRARQGFSPTDVAMFVLSLKQPLFTTIRAELSSNQDKLFDTIWSATGILDRLALVYDGKLHRCAGRAHTQAADRNCWSSPRR